MAHGTTRSCAGGVAPVEHIDRAYHESRRSSPIRWSVESVDGNIIFSLYINRRNKSLPHTHQGQTCFTSPRDLWLCVLPRWQFNVNVKTCFTHAQKTQCDAS